MKRLFMLILAAALVASAFAQQPTSQAPITTSNVSTVQGVGPGYYPTPGAGLTLQVAPGTANCGGIVNFGGANISLAPSATSYLYLDLTASCYPAVNTTGFGNNIPIATMVTSATAITSITDVRTMFNAGQSGAGGAGAYTLINGVYHYKDVASYFHRDAGPVGTVEIALSSAITPNSSPSIDMIIDGYSWPWGSWTIQVGGIVAFGQCSGGNDNWCGASASITGAFPYGYVRLAYDTALSQYVVLLGTATTAWDRLNVRVADFTPIEALNPTALGSGWGINILTSEATVTGVNKVFNSPQFSSIGPVPSEGDQSTGNLAETSVNLEVSGGSQLDIPVYTGPAHLVYHYRDLISAYGWAQPSELEIVLPSPLLSGQTGEINMTIMGYDHTTKSAWQVMIGGMGGFPTANAWGEYSAAVYGNPPFASVRLAYDTSLNKYVVLLGTTTTAWAYAWAEVSDFIVGYQDEASWGTGWSMVPLTSEANLTNIVTPAAMWPTGKTVAASYCGSLANAAGCSVVTVNGAGTHYVPYY